MIVQLETTEELLQIVNRQIDQLGDGTSAHFYIACFLFQTGAVTSGAEGLSPIAGKHHAVLNLILVFFQHLEEGIDTCLFPRAVP